MVSFFCMPLEEGSNAGPQLEITEDGCSTFEFRERVGKDINFNFIFWYIIETFTFFYTKSGPIFSELLLMCAQHEYFCGFRGKILQIFNAKGPQKV